MHRYQVVVFKNKNQSSVLYRCRTLADAEKKYKHLIGEVKPVFHIEWKNRVAVEYHIGIISNKEKQKSMDYTKDKLGRNITMNIKSHQSLLKVRKHWIPEMIWDNQQKKRITFNDLMEQLDNIPGLKMVFKVNSHIFIEEDNNIIFFSLKNVSDCMRLVNLLIKERFSDGQTDCMFSKDTDRIHRKYLYDHLKKYGYKINDKIYKHVL